MRQNLIITSVKFKRKVNNFTSNFVFFFNIIKFSVIVLYYFRRVIFFSRLLLIFISIFISNLRTGSFSLFFILRFLKKRSDTYLFHKKFLSAVYGTSTRCNRCTNLARLSLKRSVARWTPRKYRRSLRIPVALSVVLWRGIQRFQDGPLVRLKKVVRFVHRNRQSFSLKRRRRDDFSSSFSDQRNICNRVLKKPT